MPPPPAPRYPKIQRWVDLLAALLRRHYPAPFEELERDVPAYADTLPSDASETDRKRARASRLRMFERDKDELRTFGVPIRTVLLPDGVTHGYQLTSADFYLPYLLTATAAARPRAALQRPPRGRYHKYHALRTLAFEPDELAVVAEAGDRVRALGDPTLAGDAESALRKLAFDLPVDAALPPDAPRLARRRDPVDPDVYERLGDALLRRKRVTFEYHSMGSDERARRTAEPYGLSFVGSHWYLVARDVEKDALRTFRLSRISGVEANPTRSQSADYAIPAGFSLREHARARQTWELGDGDALDVLVEFTRRTGAAAAAERLGEAVEGEPGRRRFRVRRADAFCRWLLSFAGDARPMSPEPVVAEFGRLRDATLALYRDEQGGSERRGAAGTAAVEAP